MKIGIDAKWYFEGPPSGKEVIKNLVDNLIELKTEHEFYFFIDKKFKNQFPYKSEKTIPVGIWAENNLLSNLFVVPHVVKKYNIDVFVYQNFPSFKQKYKQIAYIHDIIFVTHPQYYTLRERLYFSPLKYLVQKSDLVCTVSNSEKDRIGKNYNISMNQISVIHHGISAKFKPKEKFSSSFLTEVRKKYNLPENYLLYVGRLNVRKNIDNLLKGFSLLDRNEVKLVIVGEYDWKFNNINKIIEDNKLVNDIIFTGYVPSDDLIAIYSLASVFCFTSYVEGFGLPPLEAMSSGVPVIVSNSSSIPEICGEAGIYVDPNNPGDIAEKINKVLSDDTFRNSKIELGIQQAKKFNWTNSAKNLLAACEELS